MKEFVTMKAYSAKLEELGLTGNETGQHYMGYLRNRESDKHFATVIQELDRKRVTITYRVGGTIRKGGTDEKFTMSSLKFLSLTKTDIFKIGMKIQNVQFDVNQMLSGIENRKVSLTDNLNKAINC